MHMLYTDGAQTPLKTQTLSISQQVSASHCPLLLGNGTGFLHSWDATLICQCNCVHVLDLEMEAGLQTTPQSCSTTTLIR